MSKKGTPTWFSPDSVEVKDLWGKNPSTLQKFEREDLTEKDVRFGRFGWKARVIKTDPGQPDNTILKQDVNVAVLSTCLALNGFDFQMSLVIWHQRWNGAWNTVAKTAGEGDQGSGIDLVEAR